jgi:serine/threonine protein kinase
VIGKVLSHYKLLEEISRGGMGIVYRALDVNLDREVALKVLPPELVADSERKRRFIQEAKAAAKRVSLLHLAREPREHLGHGTFSMSEDRP